MLKNLRVQAVPPPHRKRLRKRKYTVRELPSGAELPSKVEADVGSGAAVGSEADVGTNVFCGGECAAPNIGNPALQHNAAETAIITAQITRIAAIAVFSFGGA